MLHCVCALNPSSIRTRFSLVTRALEFRIGNGLLLAIKSPELPAYASGPAIFAKPVNYGFIPQTTDEDGDELDTLVVCSEPIPTGVWLEATIVGIMNFEDDGEMDYKIVCVPADDRDSGDRIKTLDDLGDRWKQKVEYHFNHYKDLKKPGSTKVLGWGDAEEAKQIIAECAERFKNK